jgi:predicted small secreted protein
VQPGGKKNRGKKGWIADVGPGNIQHKFMKSLLITGLALGVMVALSGCNTITGMGKDMQSVGHGVERAAEWCTPE